MNTPHEVPWHPNEAHAGHAAPPDAVELYGLMAEFDRVESLLDCAERVRAAGYRHVDAYTPFPVHGLAERLGNVPARLPYLTLLGGVIGAAGGYGMQYWASVISYPMNVGGRPYHSWPAFMPVVFELGVLGAALFTVLGMLALNGLPMPYHPVFNVAQFRLASRNRFFLCLQARDPHFDVHSARALLDQLSPLAVYEVPK
jgi:hypothetical protein